jgi:hypothetical protein
MKRKMSRIEVKSKINETFPTSLELNGYKVFKQSGGKRLGLEKGGIERKCLNKLENETF